MAGIGASLLTATSRPAVGRRVWLRRSRRRRYCRGRLAGATTIVAVDLDDQKLEWAKEFGATHTVNARTQDVVEAVRAATGGSAPTSASRLSDIRKYWNKHSLRGTSPDCRAGWCAHPDMRFPDIPMIEFFGRGVR